MISYITFVSLFLHLNFCHCRTSIEEAVTVDLNAEEKAELQVERFEDDSYNVIFTLNNETFDFNITKKDLDVNVWIADDEGNTTIAEYEVGLGLHSLFSNSKYLSL